MARKTTKKGGDPLIGAVIARRWKVIDQLGAGGMGVVYLAERVGLGKQFALKFLHQSVAESKSAVARFEREAKAISRLHHLHCVSIVDFGVYRKQPYIVMELVHGRQLTELDSEMLTPSRAVALVRQMLLGLQHAHSRGVIHRDLKLSNVMLVEMTGTENLVKILDFGLARIAGHDEDVSLTGDGMVAGTPSYMSPEQALGKKADHRSDIYSAGIILYMLATGKRPFVGEDMKAVLYLQVHEPPPPPRRVTDKRISEALERVILRALEKRPGDRFQSVTEFLAALDDTPEGQQTLTPTVLRPRRQGRRWRLMAVAFMACIALGAAGAVWGPAHYQRLRARVLEAWRRSFGPEKPAAPPPVPAPPPTPAPAPADLATPDLAEPAAPEPEAAAPTPEPPPRPPAVAHDPIHKQIEGLMARGKHNPAKNLLRDRIAVQKDDAWAHLRLGDLYAVAFHYRRDAFREWDSALALEPGFKSDAPFRKSVCEAVDLTDRARVEEFLRRHFGTQDTPGLLLECIRAAAEPERIAGMTRLIETVSGADRPELGAAALRMLAVSKSCAQKEAAVRSIGRLRYLPARPALVKLERQRLGCLGTAVADALAELK
jgi:serine/threonine-protein kinase